ncbi:MAG: AI-2E family transporter [Christensenellales bacterium]
MIVGIPHYQLISVIIGVTNIIPFFGPILGLIPSAFFVLIADPAKLILFVIIVIIIQQLDGNVIGPKILGDSIGISSLGVIIAITVMSDLLGVVGMFIGVPLYVLITSILRKLLGRLETTRRSAAVGVTDGVSDAPEDMGDIDNSEISEEGADASETDGQCTDDLQTVQQKDSAENAKDGKNENGGEVNGR